MYFHQTNATTLFISNSIMLFKKETGIDVSFTVRLDHCRRFFCDANNHNLPIYLLVRDSGM